MVDRYNVDGIWMDFFRHPVFFRSNAQGLPATDDEVAAMTGLMRQLKEELDKRRIERGKYYLVSIRVPDSVEYAKLIGLDLETWLKDELADLLFTTSYLHLNDWSYSAELGHRYGVPVYPSLDESRVRSEHSLHARNHIKGFLGRIMNVWETGCDGIFMFNNSGLRDMKLNIEQNWFRKDAGTYHDGIKAALSGPEGVNTLSKTYFVSFRGLGGVAGGALPHGRHMNIPTLNYSSPVHIAANESVELPLRMSDDLASAAAKGMAPKATLTAFMLRREGSPSISINGKALAAPEPELWHEDAKDMEAHRKCISCILDSFKDLGDASAERRIVAEAPLDFLKKGINTLKIQSSIPMALLDIWLDLDYPVKTLKEA